MANLLSWAIISMLVLALLTVVTYVPASISCDSRATKMGMPFSYGLLEGCMVRVEGRWVPIEAYRVID